MKNLWNLHKQNQNIVQKSDKYPDNLITIRVINDLHRSIEYFNKTNINSSKFGSCNNYFWKEVQKQNKYFTDGQLQTEMKIQAFGQILRQGQSENQYKCLRKGLSQRNSIQVKTPQGQTNQESKQKYESCNSINNKRSLKYIRENQNSYQNNSQYANKRKYKQMLEIRQKYKKNYKKVEQSLLKQKIMPNQYQREKEKLKEIVSKAYQRDCIQRKKQKQRKLIAKATQLLLSNLHCLPKC